MLSIKDGMIIFVAVLSALIVYRLYDSLAVEEDIKAYLNKKKFEKEKDE